MRPLRIMHVSADFPDSVDAAKTPVILSLLGLVADRFDQDVWSLNRISPQPASFALDCLLGGLRPKLQLSSEPFEHGQAVRYVAPPRGFFHVTMLRQLGAELAAHIAAGPRPDILVGHKLTVEGIVVREAARRLGLPYALSIQGNTDSKILSARRDAVSEFRRVFHDAAVVFPFTSWALRDAEVRLGKRRGPTVMLPCATELDTPLPPDPEGEGLVSVFHLRGQHTKNLSGMAAAMRLLAERSSFARLAILGGGTSEQLAQCKQIAAQAPAISFEGASARADLAARLNRAAGFVLPSRRETFGLVFIEALFAGLPIIYPAGAGVDGYFDGAEFALRVDPGDPAAIADAMQHMCANQVAMKAALADWQTGPEAERFTRPAIAQAFADAIRQAATAGKEEAA